MELHVFLRKKAADVLGRSTYCSSSWFDNHHPDPSVDCASVPKRIPKSTVSFASEAWLEAFRCFEMIKEDWKGIPNIPETVDSAYMKMKS